MKIDTNYHTHCYLCRHAVGSIEDYIIVAINKDYQVIGISDHGPLNDYLANTLKTRRMKKNQFKEIYLPELATNINKYSKKIRIYKGLEIEYFKSMNDQYREYLLDLDYLILGQHFIEYNNCFYDVYQNLTKEQIYEYAQTIKTALQTGYFSILAHPDIFLWGYSKWDEYAVNASKIILQAAKENNVPIEINANGIRNCIRKNKYVVDLLDPSSNNAFAYPNFQFFSLAKLYDVNVIINDDAHDPKCLCDNATKKAYEMAEELNLNIIKYIK